MVKRYLACVHCNKRSKRTGKRELIYKSGEVKLYEREYVCPQCGAVMLYNEYQNSIR